MYDWSHPGCFASREEKEIQLPTTLKKDLVTYFWSEIVSRDKSSTSFLSGRGALKKIQLPIYL
jgi:hypothetical protein